MSAIAVLGGSGQAVQLQEMNQPLQANASAAAQAPDLAAKVGPAYTLELSGRSSEQDWNDPQLRQLKRMNQIECQTCKERKYSDVSNDPGVSFKSPTHLEPGSEAAAVASHEQEHVGNEQAKAQQEGRKVVAQSVRIFTSVCPECGRVYVSGGETDTTTARETETKAEKENAAHSSKSGSDAKIA
ncbi:hypothetical protein [Azotosporobacter soli]|uniref:hypothetical protein n=1 Tax=Azotosporobacter soli TaxID=3055040 RepID=UPI0031FF0FF7